MKLTSAQAAKLLKKLNDDFTAIISREEKSHTFNAAMGEDPDTVRPEYDYAQTQNELSLLEAKIRKLKHAVNVFNATHKVPGYDMTVDEMLIYIPQLSRKKEKLADMRAKLPKARVEFVRNTSIIDYTYTNYDIKAADADYQAVSDELSKAQLALDAFNGTETFEFEI
jgi:hypothetical protein